MKKLYMHTLHGRPAYYWDNKQIVYVGLKIKTSQMVKSLDTIRRQQRMSNKWRLEKGYDAWDKQDYIIVDIDTPTKGVAK